MTLALRAHAKINLSLEVLGSRPDGYHSLKTVFQSLALHDCLRFEETSGEFSLDCDVAGVPLDSRNLVWRAASFLWEAAGRAGRPSGARVTIEKRIPVQAGLGGGSSDAAASLVGLNQLWGARLGPEILARLAARTGADVPFFLCGGTAIGLDRGDEIHPLADLPACSVVLVFPPFGVSTPEAYAWLDEDSGAAPPGPCSPPEAPRVLLPGGVSLEVRNDLEPPVAARRPAIGAARLALEACGAAASRMSGSGSTVFGLFSSAGRAESAVAALRRGGWVVLLTETAGRERARPFLV